MAYHSIPVRPSGYPAASDRQAIALQRVAIELITRSGCHLCDQAADLLRRSAVPFESRDVDADPELLRLYDFRVPVILRDGTVIAEGKVGEAALDGLSRT